MITIRALLILLLAATISMPVAAKEPIVPKGSENIVSDFHYSPAVRAGDFIFASGVVAWLPIDEQGNVGPASAENLRKAFADAFDSIATVLSAAGANWDDVVEMTTYHTDLEAQAEVFVAVKDRYVKAPYPAWTAIDIDQLFRKHGLVEIKIVAHRPK